MEIERFQESELVRQRAANILQAQAAIKRKIWSFVPATAIHAYSRLDAAAYVGVNITGESFLAQERSTINSAFAAFSAHLQQALVERAMVAMLDLNRRAPRESHVVELFPYAQPDNDLSQRASVIDVLKMKPQQFKEVVFRSDEQARQQVVNTVIDPDKLAKIGLHPLELYSSIIVGDNHVVSVPTIMEGIYLRHKTIKGAPEKRVVEFVMEAL